MCPAAGNIISANGNPGVAIEGEQSTGNKIQGNYIGVNVTGTVGLGNGASGVGITYGASANVVGTDGDGSGDADEGNVISDHTSSLATGVYVTGGGHHNVVAGNLIGTDVTGTSHLGNATGVYVSGASHNRIGTDGDGLDDGLEGNLIVGNTTGVCIFGADTLGNSIRGNSIFDNAGLGIDLCNDGVTLNDLGDPDTGPNNLQNFPVISRVDAGATTRVVGRLQRCV